MTGVTGVAGLITRTPVLPPAAVALAAGVSAGSNVFYAPDDPERLQPRQSVVPSQASLSGRGELPLGGYRATLVTFKAGLPLGRDPAATLLALAARHRLIYLPFENSSFQDANNGATVTQQGAAGTLVLSTAIKKFGAGSLLVDNTADGAAKWLSIPIAPSTPTWTAGYWFYDTDNPRTNVARVQLVLAHGTGLSQNIAVVRSDNGNIAVYEGATLKLTSTVVPGHSTWYHVAIACTGTAVSLYVNGASMGSFGTTAQFAHVNSLSLSSDGKFDSQTHRGARGHFDDFEFHYRTLTADEIRLDLTGPRGGLSAAQTATSVPLLTAGIAYPGTAWAVGTSYPTLANAKAFAARLDVDGLGASSSGVLLEFGGADVGYALYAHGGKLYQDYGASTDVNGSPAVNASRVLLEVDLAALRLPAGRVTVEAFASVSSGAAVAINGTVVASHARSAGNAAALGGVNATALSGPDAGGVGSAVTATRSNYGGWTAAGSGAFTGTIASAVVWKAETPVVATATAFANSVVTSVATMEANSFNTQGSGPTSDATPHAGMRNLPAFLVGVPMTKGINNQTLQASFTGGRIHAYGFRQKNWANSYNDTTLVYEGNRYDHPGDNYSVTQVVHKYFEDASFTINTRSYMWFFTRTPPGLARVLLHGQGRARNFLPFELSSFQDVNGGAVVTQHGTNGTLAFSADIKKNGAGALILTNPGGVARWLSVPLAPSTPTWTAGYWFYNANPAGFDFHVQLILAHGTLPNQSIAVVGRTVTSQIRVYQGAEVKLDVAGPPVPGHLASWYHVAIACTGTQVSLYIDGALKGSFATTAQYANVNNAILSSNGSTTYHFWGANGCFDDFKFHDKALSAGEIGYMMD